MTESCFLREVLRLCTAYGVLAFHSGDPRRDTGRGFPDLVLVGKHSVLFAELKAEGHRPEGDQVTWKYRIVAAGGNWVWWLPSDLELGLIEKTLKTL